MYNSFRRSPEGAVNKYIKESVVTVVGAVNMLISGLKPQKSRGSEKDNYVKKQGITGGQPGRLYTWSFQMKSFPHRINMVVHMRMLINNSKPRERLIGVNLLADGSDGTDGGIIVL